MLSWKGIRCRHHSKRALCRARREVQVGVLIDARELFQAVRELAELGRQTCKVSRAKEARVIDARPIFLALKVGVPRSALPQGRDKDI